MGRNRRVVGAALALPALALVVLAACSGGGEDDAGGATLGTVVGTEDECWIVVRYDRDRDAHLDLLTLDASRNPLVIVEALRGTPNGGAVDVTSSWKGGTLDFAINDALQLYLAESVSVGSPTDLDIPVNGKTVTVTVIE